jgi:putative transposase
VYNQVNYIARQSVFNGEKIPSYYEAKVEIQKNPDYQLLGRSYSSPRLQIYFETNSARFKLIKSGTQKKVGLPKYLKNRKTNTTIPSYLVIDNCQYCITKSHVRIPLSNKMRKKYNLKSFNIPYNGVLKWKGEQQRGQVKFKDNKFYLHQSVEVKEPEPSCSKGIAGLDMGIKRLFTAYADNGESLVIGSKRFYNQWLYFTSKIAEEQKRLDSIDRKSSNKLKRLFTARKRYFNNLLNNAVSKLFRFLKRNDVSMLYVGDVKNIREDNNLGKAVNQMVHNYWSFDLQYRKLGNKSEENGIVHERIDESYTSMTCPVCGDSSVENKKDRIFVCSLCGYIDDRDIVGAKNIMFTGMHSQTERVHWKEILPLETVKC